MCDSNWKLTVAMCGIVNTKVMHSCEVRIVVYMCVCVSTGVPQDVLCNVTYVLRDISDNSQISAV